MVIITWGKWKQKNTLKIVQQGKQCMKNCRNLYQAVNMCILMRMTRRWFNSRWQGTSYKSCWWWPKDDYRTKKFNNVIVGDSRLMRMQFVALNNNRRLLLLMCYCATFQALMWPHYKEGGSQKETPIIHFFTK